MAQQHGTSGAEKNPGNFANDREKAAQAGKTGGEHSHGGGSHSGGSHSGGSSGSQGNFGQDREKASEAGRKGGQH
jgi:uncharacterized protein